MTVPGGLDLAPSVLPVLLAGGESRRFGSPKALAHIAGRPLFEHGIEALQRAAGCDAVVVANVAGPFESIGVRVRADVRPGTGALGGVLTAVSWAEEEGHVAALVLACDMPFVDAGLLRRLATEAAPGVISVPESRGPRGFEPLCGAYGIGARRPIEAALDRGDRSIISFFGTMDVRRLSLADVERIGDPARLFFNVNRPDEREKAERMAEERPT